MPIRALPPAEVGALLALDDAAPIPGGCIHDAYRVRVGGHSRFLKVNDARYADAFAAEADGLQALRTAGLRTPAVLAHGTAGAHAFLLLEFLELRQSGDFAALGRMLAAAHRCAGPRFGWKRDNYIGATPQANGWCDDWATFWRERRLGPQLQLAREKGFDLPTPDVSLLEGHHPRPSLLHGDLWRGNVGFTAEGPALFDPAVYYGDREADVAMTELFGRFPPAFYEGYESVWPLEPGYGQRRLLYNFYHLLNHLNLFGGGYLGQVQATLGLLGRLGLRP